MNRPLVLATAALISTAGSAALAQMPQRTTATYGNWTVRCVMHSKTRICEMTQATQIKGRPQPITQIAIGSRTKKGPLTMSFKVPVIVFEVPVNVWLSDGVELMTSKKQADIRASFSRCVPAGCIAETNINADEIEKLSRLKRNGKLQFRSAGRRLIAIPVSFKGFGDAYEALQK